MTSNNGAPACANEFRFSRGRKLEVHAAHGALVTVVADIGLYDHRVASVRDELLLAEGARKEPTGIIVTVQFDNEGALQLGFNEQHSRIQRCEEKSCGGEVRKEPGSAFARGLVKQALSQTGRTDADPEPARFIEYFLVATAVRASPQRSCRLIR